MKDQNEINYMETSMNFSNQRSDKLQRPDSSRFLILKLFNVKALKKNYNWPPELLQIFHHKGFLRVYLERMI